MSSMLSEFLSTVVVFCEYHGWTGSENDVDGNFEQVTKYGVQCAR